MTPIPIRARADIYLSDAQVCPINSPFYPHIMFFLEPFSSMTRAHTFTASVAEVFFIKLSGFFKSQGWCFKQFDGLWLLTVSGLSSPAVERSSDSIESAFLFNSHSSPIVKTGISTGKKLYCTLYLAKVNFSVVSLAFSFFLSNPGIKKMPECQKNMNLNK